MCPFSNSFLFIYTKNLQTMCSVTLFTSVDLSPPLSSFPSTSISLSTTYLTDCSYLSLCSGSCSLLVSLSTRDLYSIIFDPSSCHLISLNIMFLICLMSNLSQCNVSYLSFWRGWLILKRKSNCSKASTVWTISFQKVFSTKFQIYKFVVLSPESLMLGFYTL